MAFNWQTFRTRSLTAIIFLLIMLAGLFWNRWTFLALFTVIHFGCWVEYFRLLSKIYNRPFHIYTRLGFMLLGYGLMLWFCGPAYHVDGYMLSANLSMPFSLAGFVILLLGIFQKQSIEIRSMTAAALGILYISLSWGLMMSLRSQLTFPVAPLTVPSRSAGQFFLAMMENRVFHFMGMMLSMLVIGTMWVNDTMAYIVGSIIGKTPLSRISPKKTWEGTIGGIILASVAVGLLIAIPNEQHVSDQQLFPFSLITWMMIALIAAIAGTFGDLLESKLKRMAGVKDSGQIMPGHGGFLDRFDSLLLAVPFVWLTVKLLIYFSASK